MTFKKTGPRFCADFRPGRLGRAIDQQHLEERPGLRDLCIPEPPDDCFTIQHRSPLQIEIDADFDDTLRTARGILNGVLASIVIVACIVAIVLYAVGP